MIPKSVFDDLGNAFGAMIRGLVVTVIMGISIVILIGIIIYMLFA